MLVINKVSLIQPLPIAYRDRLARVPGVKEVTFANWFGGVYQDEKNFFAQFAIDHETYRAAVHGVPGPRRPVAGVPADKQGASSGKATAERFGWKVGDRIPIQGAIYPGRLGVQPARHLHGQRPQRRPDAVLVPLGLPEARRRPPWAKNVVGLVHGARRAGRGRACRSARAIDEAFANSPWETRTQSEKAFMASFVEQMGNIEFLMLRSAAWCSSRCCW